MHNTRMAQRACGAKRHKLFATVGVRPFGLSRTATTRTRRILINAHNEQIGEAFKDNQYTGKVNENGPLKPRRQCGCGKKNTNKKAKRTRSVFSLCLLWGCRARITTVTPQNSFFLCLIVLTLARLKIALTGLFAILRVYSFYRAQTVRKNGRRLLPSCLPVYCRKSLSFRQCSNNSDIVRKIVFVYRSCFPSVLCIFPLKVFAYLLYSIVGSVANNGVVTLTV